MVNENNCCSSLSPWLPVRLFKGLSDPNRVAILAGLAEHPEGKTVSQIGTWFPLNISVVSRHLSTLKDAGVLSAEKRGKEVFYSVKYNQLVALLRSLADGLETCCPGGICTPGRQEKPL